MVSKLAITMDELVDVHIFKLAMGIHDACIELAKVQLELNLQIA